MAIVISIVTLIAIFLTSTLKLQTGYENLLPKDNPRVNEFNIILEEFENESNIILLAKGEEKQLKKYADQVKVYLEEYDQYIKSVHARISEDFFHNNALKLLNESQLENFQDLYSNPNLIPYLTHLNDSFEKEYIGDEGIDGNQKEIETVRFLDGIQRFVQLQQEVLNGHRPDNVGQVAVNFITFGEPYFMSPDKDMILIMIEPTFNMLTDINFIAEAVNQIEKVAKDTASSFNVEAGVTGSIVLGRDELHAIESDSMIITILALIGIFFLFVFAFRMWMSPFLAIITVVLGVVWAMGFSALLIDYLSIMTAMMGVILVGLGIDFSVHIISGYSEKRHQGFAVHESMVETLTRFGPGIITGGFTTGIAFLTMMIGDSTGIQEFGLIAGLGIIITMFATIIILPTLLVIHERLLKTYEKQLQIQDVSYPFLGNTAVRVFKHWKKIGISIGIISLILMYKSFKLETDYNYLNMEPEGLESIKLQEEMIDAFDISSDFIMFTAHTIEEVNNLTKKARDMATSGWVESISDYLPADSIGPKQFHFIRNLRRDIKSSKVDKNVSLRDFEVFREQLERLEFNIIELQDLAFLSGQDKIYKKTKSIIGEVGDSVNIGSLTQFINNVNPDKHKLPLTYFQQRFASAFQKTILNMANNEPLTIDNLPLEIKDRFTGKNKNLFLITVYPKKNIWEDIQFLNRFSEEATSIHSSATGLPPIFVELMDIMSQDGKRATYLAIFAVFILLMLDFKSYKYALLGMTPLVFGVIWLTGFMELVGLKFTMMNIMAIPLIIGIGIDDGIHILHRYKIEKNLNIVFRSTGKAILLTSLTTMIGFGSLWFATYRGLGSLGIALFIGVCACFLATLFVIPSILGFYQTRKLKY
jgi:hypothetical protein